MKVRNGFVSNSSSSSFIVAIPKSVDVSDSKQLKQLLFGDTEFLEAYDGAYTTSQIAATVSGDFSEQSGELKNVGKYLLDEGDYEPRRSDYESDDVYERVLDGYKAQNEKAWEASIKQFTAKITADAYNYFHVVYSDDDGAYYSTLEHSGIFDNVHHVRISRH